MNGFLFATFSKRCVHITSYCYHLHIISLNAANLHRASQKLREFMTWAVLLDIMTVECPVALRIWGVSLKLNYVDQPSPAQEYQVGVDGHPKARPPLDLKGEFGWTFGTLHEGSGGVASLVTVP
ncbi:hypothetical protein RRG08_036542 [Elysia crispata]|uniref:Uncharacterized protein n=1 Tax=Elysia crispata TaxID=231223 RepID=A0AAE0XY49_9GAST|nr:hypothetical protein RRG08_036542 [Elysia crispata]